MRIIGNIAHPSMKITIFELETKFMLKFEQDLFEVTYKLRKGPAIQNLNDITKMVDDIFMDQVLLDLAKMNVHCMDMIKRTIQGQEAEDWDDII